MSCSSSVGTTRSASHDPGKIDSQDLSDFTDDWHCLITRPGNGFATNGYLATGRETWAFDANSDTYVNFSGPCAFKGLF